MRAFLYVFLNKYYSGDQVKKNNVGMLRGMYGGQERFVQGSGGVKSGKETTWMT